ncbi:phosphoribosylanthranilate isomerase [Roseomonas sp. OT10]|uniref:phosphoribosylanthranilate isomerase n=1 Tax=Roseomonas cutis TaxID=2897332 RepID=UPI001E37E0D0|nr:phosphoribosylanthranilate isomerase [Roseomonas sp. OT10]UFN51238.1 phosphoribosylanthranilate isomerase [Roseomonas sp. OT10]
MAVAVKICGLNDPAGFEAAVAAGAELIGLNFFPPSPRSVTPATAAALSALGPAWAEGGPERVGLFVDPADDLLDAVLAALRLDVVQLHGAEAPERVAAIRARLGLPVMKVIGIATAADLAEIDRYAPVADRLLLDARAPPGAALPGGNATAFDWSLLAGRVVPRPWLLAGGLTPGNVAGAIRLTGAPGVDVSSGVESARGRKDPALVRDFVRQAKGEGAPRAATPAEPLHGARTG